MFSSKNSTDQIERKERINFLVREILAGRRECIYELWELLEGLCAWFCRRIHRELPREFGLEYEDLYNCGFIALHEALSHCSEEKMGNFSTYYTPWLLSTIYRENALSKGGHYKDGRRRFDPVITAGTMSLDAPVEGDDGKTDTIYNFLTDEHPDIALDTITKAENQIFLEQLRRVMEDLLAKLPEDDRFVIRQKYYRDLNCAEIAEQLKTSRQRVYQLEDQALIFLRRRGESCGLEQYLGYRINYYAGTGIKRFRESGVSSVERLATRRMELEDRYKQLYGGETAINNGESR